MSLSEAWLSRCPKTSSLHNEIQHIIARLSIQSILHELGALTEPEKLPSGLTSEQKSLVEAWGLYHKARFDKLDGVIRNLSGHIRVDSPTYPAFFLLVHFSRIGRSSKESQFVSLSRLRFIESRQPAQVCQQYRDERFETNFADIARRGFPDGAATARFTCFRMAMQNQLHDLRSWDLGGWILGERQRAQSLLELAARGDIRFVKSGILALKNSLGVPKKGEYPHFDRAVEMLDALAEEDRRSITKELVASPRIAWSAAHRVLSDLSDAIPADELSHVAEWYSVLDQDTYYAGWSRSWLEQWGNLLGWCDDAPAIIEILKPAVLARASDDRCWDELHDTLCTAIVKAKFDTAREMVVALIGSDSEKVDANRYRYSILHNVVRHRPELAAPARKWLEEYLQKQPDPYQSFTFRHVDGPPERAIDDDEFRKWVRSTVLNNCEKMLEERGPGATLGLKQYHSMMFQLSWPSPEPELIQKLIAVVNADYVPFINKGDPIACLAVLASRLASAHSLDIVNAAIGWLEMGISGREFGGPNPLSTGQVMGMSRESIVPAFSYLTKVMAKEHFNAAGEKLAKWVIAQAIRQPTNVVDDTLQTAIYCSIGMGRKDPALALALVAMAEGVANAAFRVEPAKTLNGFVEPALHASPLTDLSDWLASPAGKLCLELWERRIVEASRLTRPTSREAAAVAIWRWEKAGIELPPILKEARERLSVDCRLRVRKALSK